MKLKQFYVHVGGRGGTSDALALSGHNARAIICNCQKIDAGTTGQLFAQNNILKPYIYAASLKHDDAPSSLYEFRTADISNGTTAHEEVSGAAITVTNNGVITGSLGAARYGGQYGMLNTTAQSTDGGAHQFLMAAENSAQNWSLEAVVSRAAAAANATLYMETNAGVTVYLQILITTAGNLQISQSGVVKWTSPGTVPLGGTHHVGLSYSAAGATVQGYLDGVSMGAATAYTRGAGWPGGQSRSGNGATGQFFVCQVATYQNALLIADDYLRHFTDLTTDVWSGGFVSGTAAIIKGGVGTVIFADEIVPGFDSGSYSLRMPLTATCYLQTANGIFLVEVTIVEWEGGE